MDITKTLADGKNTKPDSKVRAWVAELDDALKREKDWRKSACDIVKLYEGAKASESPFNILYSNTETLLPALYNNLPRPIVDRRFKDADPLGKTAARVAQRTLEFLIDNELGTYTPFDNLMQQAVLESLVPGRGVTRFKYDAALTEAGEVTYETVCGEVVPWDRFRHGYAKQWQDVPWIAFEHFMTREECVKNFPEVGVNIPLTIGGDGASQDADGEDTTKLANAEGVNLAHIFEIWDKDTKKVLFLAPAYPQGFVKEVDDPLALTGFFPLPQPLSLFQKISSLVPVPLYALYEEQAKELNRVTVRINKIVQALKVRGFYDSTLEGLEKVLTAEDNVLIPAENVAAMQQGQSLEKAIWLMPLEKLVAVLQQLYLQRQQIKQVIYEITGSSDILRGSSQASETATAQNIKNQWGTLRLKRLQKIVMRYTRDSLRIMAEIALTKFSPQTLAGMTGLNFPDDAAKQQAQMMMMQAQQTQQPPPPEVQQVLTLPTWGEVTGLLQNDLQRNYRIDIETNSTVDAEATEDKAHMGEFLNAIAQFMNGVAPMIQEGIMPFDAAKSILLAVTRRYRFGPEVEDDLAKMKAPEPKADPEADKALQAQQKALEGEKAAIEQGKAQLMEEKMKAEFQLMQDRKLLEMEKQFAMKELAQAKSLAMKEIDMHMKLQTQSAEVGMERMRMDSEQRLKDVMSEAGEARDTE
jgi:hypothetical protein